MYKTDFKSYDKQYLQTLINESASISEVLKKLGLRGAGNNHTKFKKFIKENNFDLTTLIGRKKNKVNNKGVAKKTLSENLVINSSGNSNKIKQRLIREGVKEYKCEYCGISEWNNKWLTLELHHINGNHYDNRLENLILLCPNCHSQTTNFRGKNSDFDRDLSKIAKKDCEEKYNELLKNEEIRKKEIYLNRIKYGNIPKTIKTEKVKKYCQWCGKEIIGRGEKYCSVTCASESLQKTCYTKEDILEKSKTVKSISALGRLYNLTDNGIRKWLIKFNILDDVRKNFLK